MVRCRCRKPLFRKVRGRAAQRTFDAFLRSSKRNVDEYWDVQGVTAFSVWCPKTHKRPAYQSGTSLIMAQTDDPNGPSVAYFMPLLRWGRPISEDDAQSGRRFPSRPEALAWLTEQAEKLGC